MVMGTVVIITRPKAMHRKACCKATIYQTVGCRELLCFLGKLQQATLCYQAAQTLLTPWLDRHTAHPQINCMSQVMQKSKEARPSGKQAGKQASKSFSQKARKQASKQAGKVTKQARPEATRGKQSSQPTSRKQTENSGQAEKYLSHVHLQNTLFEVA